MLGETHPYSTQQGKSALPVLVGSEHKPATQGARATTPRAKVMIGRQDSSEWPSPQPSTVSTIESKQIFQVLTVMTCSHRNT